MTKDEAIALLKRALPIIERSIVEHAGTPHGWPPLEFSRLRRDIEKALAEPETDERMQGREDVAKQLVIAIYGKWNDHPPYTDLLRHIVEDSNGGVVGALRELQHRLTANLRTGLT